MLKSKAWHKLCTLVLSFIFWTATMAGHASGKDWLLENSTYKASVTQSADGKSIEISNGLVRRVFLIKPNAACISYENLGNGQQLVRAIQPEAVVVVGNDTLNIGGLHGQKERAYLSPAWAETFRGGAHDFQFVGYKLGKIDPFIRWKKAFWTKSIKPASGKSLTMSYRSDKYDGLAVDVHYAIYDGIPLISKWVTVVNRMHKEVIIKRVVSETLALVEEESAVVGSIGQMEKPSGIYFENDYAFNNSMRYHLSDQATHWKADSAYTSQVNYNFTTPCKVEIYPEKVTAVSLAPGDSLISLRTHELLQDSYDRERRGLGVRKMYDAIAPWTAQNPIFMHLVSQNDDQVYEAVRQCKATGYEAVIMSFGSHCDMEDTTAANVARWKKIADFAHQNGIRLGAYSLFSSRRISDEDDVIDPVSGLPDKSAFFGHAPCLGSKWGLAYLDKLKFFMKNVGIDIFENDGPYPGDLCASVVHPGHTGLGDSQWKQIALQKELYHWCSENGIYVNSPDWYFLDGSNKIALGYREVNFGLPREQQMVLNRQNIFDGTWDKTPSMGWGFVPLVAYQGANPDALIEPLKDHLKDYDQLMAQYYGAGVQACYRGFRLYDTETTKQVVTNRVSWYKKYRDILNADIIHLRRADGRDWDGFLHADPYGREKGLMMLFNPLGKAITRTIQIPVYYTGLLQKVKLTDQYGTIRNLPVSRDYKITLEVTIPADSYLWYVLQ